MGGPAGSVSQGAFWEVAGVSCPSQLLEEEAQGMAGEEFLGRETLTSLVSLDPQQSCKKPGMAVCNCSRSADEAKLGGSLESTGEPV